MHQNSIWFPLEKWDRQQNMGPTKIAQPGTAWQLRAFLFPDHSVATGHCVDSWLGSCSCTDVAEVDVLSSWCSCCGQGIIPTWWISIVAIAWVEMWAYTAWCTCQGVQFFLLNLLSFLAFQRYQRVSRILLKRASGIELGNTVWRLFWTPSCSCGRLLVLRGGSKENHTAQGNWQWKKRWASSSRAPQTVQCSSMCALYLPALSLLTSC